MSAPRSCQRCKVSSASVLSRKEYFCDTCFRKFVSLKQRKQMMSGEYFQQLFKVIYQDKKKTQEEADMINNESRILVPLSLGSSSLVLLDILNDTLTEQKLTHKGKTGFQVDVITLFLTSEATKVREFVEKLKSERYVSNYDKLNFHLIDIQSFFQSGTHLFRVILDDISYTAKKSKLNENEYSVQGLLESFTNRSAREDIFSILVERLIKTFAYQHSFKAILWGHSMTRLADGIISSVVKGRGSQIPDALDDENMDSSYECRFKNLHPLRDVLLSEIDAYCFITGLTEYTYQYRPQQNLLLASDSTKGSNNATSRLARNMTINELARQYFENIEEGYSNIISTVVRTGAKLTSPIDTLSEQQQCCICEQRIYKDGSAWLRDITVNNGHPLEGREDEAYFKLWSESQQGQERSGYISLKTQMAAKGLDAPICYGCIITLGDVKNKTICWPICEEIESRKVLNEFIIGDDSDDDA
ncbi:LAFE_0F06040g1_1 [Lachancea fermentati]|uniref:Cytoplasmic tRNA 2-thiolation protein 2 n=1 Tax=Lachancea fermentati TaxID=4955 RepID=A0A1G4MEU1_LACFM|nr:LAFE_0F06040g1_1 [Lachancea fermentati]